jgi:hypothetical protein
MERKNIVLLSLLSVVAAVPILGRSAQRLASDYLGSPTRSSSENLSIKRYVAAGDRAYEVGTLDGAFPQIGWHVRRRCLLNLVGFSPERPATERLETS